MRASACGARAADLHGHVCVLHGGVLQNPLCGERGGSHVICACVVLYRCFGARGPVVDSPWRGECMAGAGNAFSVFVWRDIAS